jgi:hypothetical protein
MLPGSSGSSLAIFSNSTMGLPSYVTKSGVAVSWLLIYGDEL